nr:hypothetical protein [Tanacetum cinerariifolium]
MSRDVITVGSTMRIPLLYRGEYSQWREQFMNFLEEQTDGEAMINSIQNGDQPLPVIAQVSLPNDIYSLIDSNETAKDLWDALERWMRGSEYGKQDTKAAILYEYEIFKVTKGEQLLDTYLRYLQVINDLKKCGYKKDNWDVNDALGYKKKAVVVTSDPLALADEKTKITALLAKAFNRKKYYAKPTNNNLRTSSAFSSVNKKPEYVKSVEKKEDKKADEKKRDMNKVKCYNCKKEGHFAKDCKKANVKDYNYYKTKMLLAKKDSDEQVLLAKDQAWMESRQGKGLRYLQYWSLRFVNFAPVFCYKGNEYSVNQPLNIQNKPDAHELISKLIQQKLQNEYAQPFLAIAITLDLPTVEPKDSLRTGDEHLDTIPEKESDEFINSSVENPVPNPSESEDLSDSEYDVPACDEFTTFSNLLFDVDYDFSSSDDESFSDEDISKKIDSNPLFDEEIISIKIDLHHFDVESDLIESLLNQDSSIMSSSLKIDSYLAEFAGELILLKTIPPGIDKTDCDPKEEIHLIEKLLYGNSSPRPLKEFIFENYDAAIESFSPSHIPIEDIDPFMEEIDLFLTSDGSIPPCIDNDYSDSEGDNLFLERLLHDDHIPFLDTLDFSNVV